MSAGRHGATPEFWRPDNREDAIGRAALDAGVSVGVARAVIVAFSTAWSGPRGGSKTLLRVAADIAEAAKEIAAA